MNTIFCRGCGKQIPEASSHCPECGAPQGNHAPVTKPAISPGAPENKSRSVKSPFKLPIAKNAIAFLVVIVIGVPALKFGYSAYQDYRARGSDSEAVKRANMERLRDAMATSAPSAMPTSSASVDSDKSIKTRAGVVEAVGQSYEMSLNFNGAAIAKPPGYELSLQRKFALSDSDVVLVQNDSGGRACPVKYLMVTVPLAGTAQVSSEFGTCSDMVTTEVQGDEVVISMPSPTGPKSYRYRAGTITESAAR